MMDIVNMQEASIILALPEFLIRDFVSYEFNGRKLIPIKGDSTAYTFLVSEIKNFQQHLEAPWPGTDRCKPPQYIERYLIYEALGICSLCREPKPNYELAHVRSWPDSRCNSPHNLLRLCLDCHSSYGNDTKLLRGVKEECLRRIQLVDLGLIYDCPADIITGEAVYVLEGKVYRAIASSDRKNLAVGFVSTKIGANRCMVQRSGVVVGMSGLVPGQEYFLSQMKPGRATLRAELESRGLLQPLGRAESSSHLAIQFGSDLEYTALK